MLLPFYSIAVRSFPRISRPFPSAVCTLQFKGLYSISSCKISVAKLPPMHLIDAPVSIRPDIDRPNIETVAYGRISGDIIPDID